MDRHISIHSNEYLFNCNYCDINFINNERLKEHKRLAHFTAKRFVCPQNDCNKRFKTKSHLNSHKRIHSSDINKPFEFNVKDCGKRFTQKSVLNIHIDRHNGIKKHKCIHNNCHKSFITYAELKRHIRYSHSTIKEYKCKFDNCNKEFKFELSLKTHIEMHHGDGRLYSCDITGCYKKFKSRRSVFEHKRNVHCNVGPFECPRSDCNKTFKTKSGQIRHKRTHSSDKSLKCDEYDINIKN